MMKNKNDKKHTLKIYYNLKGDSYIRLYNKRLYLKDFIYHKNTNDLYNNDYYFYNIEIIYDINDKIKFIEATPIY